MRNIDEQGIGGSREASRCGDRNHHGEDERTDRDSGHEPSISRKGEAVLKTLLAALVLVLAPLPALADASLAGVVRDQDGYAVAGASVSIVPPGGAAGALTATDAGGTFYFEAVPAGSELVVLCRYCRVRHLALDGAPSRVVVVERSAVLRDRGLSADDLRALPYGSVAGAAALLPFAVANGASVSDRGLARGRGTVVADGIPGYRALDGAELTSAMPARAVTSIDELSPIAANAGDERTAGGLFGAGTRDDAVESARVDAGGQPDVAVRGGGALRYSAATGGGRTYASFHAPLAVPGGTIGISVAGARDAASGLSWQGTALDYRRDLPTASLGASFSGAHSNAAAGNEGDTVASASYARGGVLAGVRARVSTASGLGIAGTQIDDRAFVQFERSGTAGSAFVSLALAHAANNVAGRGAVLDMLLPEIALSTRTAARFRAGVTLVNALLAPPFIAIVFSPLPTYAVDASHLLEGSLTYDDGSALRVSAVVFRERISGSQPAVLGGSGVSAVWQALPGLAVRTWTLVSKQSVRAAVPDAYGPPGDYSMVSSTVDASRNLVWLTFGRGWRADVLAHGGALEGDLLAPLGARVALVAGTYRAPSGRTSTLGLSFR